MNFRRYGNEIVLVPEVGEEIVEAIKTLCDREKIACAKVTGIGGVNRATVGCFSLTENRYMTKTYEETMEMVSLTGNVSKNNGNTHVHLHASFANESCQLVGGHLIEAVVGITAEIFITVFDGELTRKPNDDIKGLTLLDI